VTVIFVINILAIGLRCRFSGSHCGFGKQSCKLASAIHIASLLNLIYWFIETLLQQGGHRCQRTERSGKFSKANPRSRGRGPSQAGFWKTAKCRSLTRSLLLDDFRNTDPHQYIKGFPWHPHRGIETITYVLKGNVEHGDSMGNKGVITSGDMQWMTAGSGIIHQEMPRGDDDGVIEVFNSGPTFRSRTR